MHCFVMSNTDYVHVCYVKYRLCTCRLCQVQTMYMYVMSITDFACHAMFDRRCVVSDSFSGLQRLL